MARNIEIKARVRDAAALAGRVAELADQGPTLIEQDDTFFACKDGRLKLRMFSETEGELIFYRRPDEAGPKTSFYLRTPTSDPAGLRETLTLALGQIGRVVKRRTLFLIGRTRVHIDRVEGLGDFCELEVVLREDEDGAVGVEEARALMRQLEIEAGNLIETAYLDLLAAP
ncbi:MAG: class IV adenylate cyclase [Planctomycetes bacterium]|nr:class IV adenylate cyclase [Planctomycetota bacterium]